MCRWRSPLDNRARTCSSASTAGDRRVLALRRPARHDVDPQSVVEEGAAGLRLPSCRAELSRAPASTRRSTPGHQHPGHRAVARGAARARASNAVIHVCASSEVFGRVPKEKLPIDEECTLPSGLALRHLQGRHRSGRPLLRRGLRHEGHDHAHVHPHRPAARRRVRRIDLRQADRDDRAAACIAAGGQGRQPGLAAHLVGRARRGARLPPAGDGESAVRARTTTSAATSPAPSATC